MPIKSTKIQDFPSRLIESLKQLDQSFVVQSWNDKQWDELFSSSWETQIFYDEDEELAGFALFHLNFLARQAHLLKIVTASMYRRQGRARRLMRSALKSFSKCDELDSIYLEVEEQNTAAVTFYRSFGFEILLRQPGYYSNGSTGLKMLLQLADNWKTD